MSSVNVEEIVTRYSEKLRSVNYPFSRIVLFGSHAKGTARDDSDIDVAVVSDALKADTQSNRLLLWKYRRDVDNTDRSCLHPTAVNSPHMPIARIRDDR